MAYRNEDRGLALAEMLSETYGEEISELSEEWVSLYDILISRVRSWIFRAKIPAWKGQEDDVALDIVQETLRRILNYALNTQQHNVTITFMDRLGIVIARNVLRERCRRNSQMQYIEDWNDILDDGNFYHCNSPTHIDMLGKSDGADSMMSKAFDECVCDLSFPSVGRESARSVIKDHKPCPMFRVYNC